LVGEIGLSPLTQMQLTVRDDRISLSVHTPVTREHHLRMSMITIPMIYSSATLILSPL
jgi:hypothetical protein